MKCILIALLMVVLGVVLFAGCKKPDSQAKDDGHGHGPGGHGEAKAHTETKDGVQMCAEHGVPEAECAVCKPDLAARLKPGESMRVRLPSTNSVAIVGIQTATPESGRIADGIECVAEVSFNQNKLAQIAAPVSGVVQTVDVDLGTGVKDDLKVSEYVIIGTLASFAWSIAVSFVTIVLLTKLPPLGIPDLTP